MEAAEDAGRLEVEWLPFELRPAPKPLLEVRGDHLRTDWTQQRVPARARRRGSRSTCRATSLARRCRWRRASGPATRDGSAAFKHALYEAFFCEGLDIATDARDRPRRGRARGSTRSRRSRRPTTTRRVERLRSIRREAEAGGVAGVPTLLTEDGRTHWGMGGVERLLADEPLVPRSTASGRPRRGVVGSRAMGIGVDRERSAARIEREIETLSGPEFTTIERGDPAVRLHARVPADARPLRRRAPRARLHRRGGSRRHARRAQPARRASRRSASARTATRTGTAGATTGRWASSPRSRCAG